MNRMQLCIFTVCLTFCVVEANVIREQEHENNETAEYDFEELYNDYDNSALDWLDFSAKPNDTDNDGLGSDSDWMNLTMTNGSMSAPQSHKESKPKRLFPKFLTKQDFERASHLTPEELTGGLDAIYIHGEEYNHTAILLWLRDQLKDGNDLKTEDIDLMLESQRLKTDDAQHNAQRGAYRRWPNGRVPYVIDRRYSVRARSNIAAAIAAYHKHTCIRFVARRATDADYVRIVYNPYSGCSSMVGRQGGVQFVTLGGTCANTVGTPMHELMHAVGFQHEQSRPDRDSYINVLWHTIIKDMQYNYFKKTTRQVDTQGIDYDYYSIMHYRLWGGFSIYPGAKTMQPTRTVDERRIGNGQTFSPSDINKINKLYSCGGTTTGPVDPTDETTTVQPTAGNCKDEHIWCSDWAKKGECTRNPAFMEGTCKRSCKKCPSVSNCEDLDQNCGYWGAAGYCSSSSRAFMMANCPKTCGKCGKPTTNTCVDSHRHCSYWSRNGECRRSATYMNANCAKSCNWCSSRANGGTSGANNTETTTEAVTRDRACVDKGRYCSDWSRKGECRRNPAYMRTQCRLSCNLCPSKSMAGADRAASCRDYGEHCADWTRKGECARNPAYMHTYCKRSCKLC